MAQNLLFGGLRDDNGEPEDRWPALLERVKRVSPAPDFLLVQEAENWSRHGHKPLVRAMNDLDMDALPLPPSSSGNLPALLYQPKTVGRWQGWNTEYAGHTVHGFGVAAFEVGLPALLSVSSVHLNFFSSDLAIEEAALITNRAYCYGPFAIIGGDVNYQPSRDPDPDYGPMLPYNISMRTRLSDPAKNEPLAPDRRVGWKLEQAGFVDVAYQMYKKTNDTRFLEHTAPGIRIDQFWVSQPLVPAITSYWIVDQPAEASDHEGIAFQLDTDLIDTSNIWQPH